MPTYVYQCKDCGHRFELFQSFTAEALDTCPECSKVALRKVLFPAGVVFKGSGFYVNDSRESRPKSKTADSKPKTDKKPEKQPASSNGSSTKKPAKTGSRSKDRG